ncbi:MAG: outer membrane lipoprotein-sorting protein [Kiritimatiellae bacterium]|nr:outer membrane lipoprotein-sorting protein [Kiritimatiellia bacterium]
MISILAAMLLSTNATPRQLVQSCRDMIPRNVEIRGELNLRNRRGISLAKYDYALVRSNAVTRLIVDGKNIEAVEGEEASAPILKTDVTWSDLTLEYLWWDDFSFDAEKEAESVHGQKCAVIILKKGERSVRVWVDRKTGALMQAEELKGSSPVRRLWGTRIKKFGERWMANVMEVETLGSGHRTKITVKSLK